MKFLHGLIDDPTVVHYCQVLSLYLIVSVFAMFLPTTSALGRALRRFAGDLANKNASPIGAFRLLGEEKPEPRDLLLALPMWNLAPNASQSLRVLSPFERPFVIHSLDLPSDVRDLLTVSELKIAGKASFYGEIPAKLLGRSVEGHETVFQLGTAQPGEEIEIVFRSSSPAPVMIFGLLRGKEGEAPPEPKG